MMSNLRPMSAREKILQLQSALFFNLSGSVLKIPNQVVHALYADELGQVWFSIPPPFQYMCEFDMEFPSQLDFFKKGKGFYLKAAGKSFIVNDPEELNHLHGIGEEVKQKVRTGKLVLLKFKIKQAACFENQHADPQYLIQKLFNKRLRQWLLFLQKPVLQGQNVKKISLPGLAGLYNLFSN